MKKSLLISALCFFAIMVLAPGKFTALNAQPISEQQQEAADKTGVSRQTIVAIENRKYFPTLELAFRIAHVFKVQLEDAFTIEFLPEGKILK